MFGLRKRAKFEEVDYEKTLDQQQHSSPIKPHLHFCALPTEVYFLIFDLLQKNDLLKMRTINLQFKCLVENYGPLWRKSQIKLNFSPKIWRTPPVKLDLKREFGFLEQFINRVPQIKRIELVCEKKFTKQDFQLVCDNKFRFNLSEKHSFSLNMVNVQSIVEYLILISNACKNIEIKSFYQQNEQFKPLSSLTVDNKRQQELLKCNYAKCLRIDCILYNNTPMNSYIMDLEIFANKILSNRMDNIFPNLTHLHLEHFDDSHSFLFSNLRHLSNLKYLEIFSSYCKKSNGDLASKFGLDCVDKLKLETLILVNSSFNMILIFFQALIDCKYLRNLSIIQKLERMRELSCEDLEKLLEILAYEATNLKTLYSDLLEESIFRPMTYKLADKYFLRLRILF